MEKMTSGESKKHSLEQQLEELNNSITERESKLIAHAKEALQQPEVFAKHAHSLLSGVRIMHSNPAYPAAAVVRAGLESDDLDIIRSSADSIGAVPVAEQEALREVLLSVVEKGLNIKTGWKEGVRVALAEGITAGFGAAAGSKRAIYANMIKDLPETAQAQFLAQATKDSDQNVRVIAKGFETDLVNKKESQLQRLKHILADY